MKLMAKGKVVPPEQQIAVDGVNYYASQLPAFFTEDALRHMGYTIEREKGDEAVARELAANLKGRQRMQAKEEKAAERQAAREAKAAAKAAKKPASRKSTKSTKRKVATKRARK